MTVTSRLALLPVAVAVLGLASHLRGRHAPSARPEAGGRADTVVVSIRDSGAHIYRSAYSATGEYSREVVRDAHAFGAVWARVAGGARPAPTVDFQTHDAIVATLGPFGTTGKVRFGIDTVVIRNGRREVIVARRISPVGCEAIPPVPRPADVVLVPRDTVHETAFVERPLARIGCRNARAATAEHLGALPGDSVIHPSAQARRVAFDDRRGIDSLRLVVRDSASWSRLWTRLTRDGSEAWTIPLVRFALEEVLLATTGVDTVLGPILRIDSVVARGSRRYVVVRRDYPRDRCLPTVEKDILVVPRDTVRETVFVERRTPAPPGC